MAYDPRPNVAIRDGINLDAFNRLRISANNILFSNEFLYNNNPLIWDETTTGAGSSTFSANRASVTMDVTGAGQSVIRQTKEYFRYLSGQSQQILCTFVGMNGVASTVKRVGYFDADNGLFLEHDGTDLKVVRRTNVTGTFVDNAVPQSAWNLDRLDGSGGSTNPSGITLNPALSNILVIDFQWLGVGRVRFGFDIDGVIRYVHEYRNANILDVVYMSTPTLPIRYEISSTGGTASLEQICAAVNREGGEQDRGILSTATTGLLANPGNATNVLRSILSVRLRASHIRGSLVPVGVGLESRQNGTFQYQLILNPTLGGALTYSDFNDGMQISTTQQTVTAGTGHVLLAGHFQRGSGTTGGVLAQTNINNLQVTASIAGVSDQLVLAVQNAGGTDDMDASISVLERY